MLIADLRKKECFPLGRKGHRNILKELPSTSTPSVPPKTKENRPSCADSWLKGQEDEPTQFNMLSFHGGRTDIPSVYFLKMFLFLLQ